MSRTRKGAKGPGYEHWTRRAWVHALGKWLAEPGRWTKTKTHRRERRLGKTEVAGPGAD